jgi:tRNA (Thr-GGU) A37 N-methylase
LRPNPIGMSLAKVEEIKGRTIYLSGIDIISNTPVIDIKPYHYKDAVDQSYLTKLEAEDPS